MFEFLELKKQAHRFTTGYIEQGLMASYDLLFVTALYRSIVGHDCSIFSQPAPDEHVTRYSVFAQPLGTTDGHCFWTIANIDAAGAFRERSVMWVPPHYLTRQLAEPKGILAMRIINTGSYFEWCTSPAENDAVRSTMLSGEREQAEAIRTFEPLTKHVDGLTQAFDGEGEHVDHLRDLIVLYQAFLKSEGDSVAARDLALERMRVATVRLLRGLSVPHSLRH
jgi:hypothetical protein